ncbi:hypothetical protein K491DRAFT_774980 [Lophiostoma macrostomum CBS 122681]|uniref:Ubiquitin-like domain-containing protein n=1 Tax=Lophiostoma macrostomum CBS 122681 TaxID=1314788 RepID=A0A6A6TJN5_9PLEO|nr:hypothetical protein K491DRAFT_774980 [Lophiostoma macrostomum CBS 122681]
MVVLIRTSRRVIASSRTRTMPVPFGFSVGDFIAAIELIGTVISSMEDSTGSSAQYQGTISSLESLRTTLELVRDIEIQDEREKRALRKVADASADTMTKFLGAIIEYQPNLREGGSGHELKDMMRKIRWSLHGHQEHVRKFQAQLQAHTTALGVILIRIQSTNARTAAVNNTRALTELELKLDQQWLIQQQFAAFMNQVIASCWTEFRAFMAWMIIINIKLFDVLTMPATRSPQIQFGQPVTFQDAHGRFFPFFLQTINTWDGFEEMLKRQFASVPGRRKIELGEYALRDKWSSRDLERSQLFQMCFRPGRSVEMSMVFHQPFHQTYIPPDMCPRCGQDNGLPNDQDQTCPNCGLSYRMSLNVPRKENIKEGHMEEQASTTNDESAQRVTACGDTEQEATAAADQIADFNRVRLETYFVTGARVWDFFSNYRLEQSVLERFLTNLFSTDMTSLVYDVSKRRYIFCIPRRLTQSERGAIKDLVFSDTMSWVTPRDGG